MARFADDAIMVFTDENDARRVMDVLPCERRPRAAEF
jgi:hypothetical protein